ncbi:SLC13 family permease [Limibacter armeniacum]|uniref:SLC13 family permease n=1 Tax=Limibacter armeniacum TaxID=466084 RepID=UPI002FE59FEE
MLDLLLHKWIVLFAITAMVGMLAWDKYRPSVVFIGAASILVILEVMPIKVLVENLANQQILTVFLLIMASSIVQKSFNTNQLFDSLFASSKSGRGFMLKMNVVVAFISSIFNNTPIVVMLMPYIYQKAKQLKVSPSKLLMPLSFSAILGGMITLIGTSTNLVLNGLLESNGIPMLKFTDFIIPGILVTIVGIIYLQLFGYKHLAKRGTLEEDIKEHFRSYFIEVKLTKGSSYIGKRIKNTDLGSLEGASLIEVIRDTETFNLINSREFQFRTGDRLIFSGSLDVILKLVQENKNIELAKTPHFRLDERLHIMEVSVPANSSLEGLRIKDTNFRKKYNATIIAVHRNGEGISGKLGELRLRNGDLLMIATNENASISMLKKDLYILSKMEDVALEKPTGFNLYWLGTFITVGLIALGYLPLFNGLMFVVFGAVLLKVTTLRQLREVLDLHLLTVMVIAVAIGQLFISTGAADMIADATLPYLLPYGNIMVLVGLMLFTVLITSFVTNVAAVSVSFPIAYSIAENLQVEGTPFYLGIAFAASAAFMTPVGYQTNLIVAGPGGYTFRDFAKIGMPLTLLYLLTIIGYLVVRYF